MAKKSKKCFRGEEEEDCWTQARNTPQTSIERRPSIDRGTEENIACSKVRSAAIITQTLEALNNKQIIFIHCTKQLGSLHQKHLFFLSLAKKEKWRKATHCTLQWRNTSMIKYTQHTHTMVSNRKRRLWRTHYTSCRYAWIHICFWQISMLCDNTTSGTHLWLMAMNGKFFFSLANAATDVMNWEDQQFHWWWRTVFTQGLTHAELPAAAEVQNLSTHLTLNDTRWSQNKARNRHGDC